MIKPISKNRIAAYEKAESKISSLSIGIDLPDHTQVLMKSLLNHYVKKILNDEWIGPVFEKTVLEYDFLFEHSLLVTAWSLLLTNAYSDRTSLKNEKIYEACILGALLHDIGLSTFPDEVIYSECEFDLNHHPRLSLKLIENAKWITDEVRFIILQHHESEDGRGYPEKLQSELIFFPAKIVNLSDAFTGLIFKRNKKQQLTAKKALEQIYKEQHCYDNLLLELLTEFTNKFEIQNNNENDAMAHLENDQQDSQLIFVKKAA